MEKHGDNDSMIKSLHFSVIYVFVPLNLWYIIVIDIIMLVFQQTNKCESINNELISLDNGLWQVQYLVLSFLAVFAVILVCSLCERSYSLKLAQLDILWMYVLCLCIFVLYIIWAGIGVVYENMDVSTQHEKNVMILYYHGLF